MTLTKQYARGLLVLAVAALSLLNLTPTFAADKAVLTKNSEAALESLYGKEPLAKAIREKAAGVLVFPSITKAGFIVGGSSGDGVLFKNGRAIDYYKTASVSVGFQAGMQSFGYALFFMTDAALENFRKSDSGWDAGAEANVVVAQSGASAEATAETAKSEIVAFVFDQKGVMGGVSLGGQKVTKVE